MVETKEMVDAKERQQLTEANGHSSNTERRSVGAFSPLADILETHEAFWVRVDLPGIKPENLSLHCQEGRLVLHGRCVPRQQGKRAVWCEYRVGDYFRSFILGEQVDGNQIDAVLKDGVLTVRLPKTEAARSRRIQVKGG